MSEIPQWLEDESENRKRRDVSQLVQRGPQFLASVISRVEANIKHLGKAAAQGRLSNLTKPDESEMLYRLDLRSTYGAPVPTYTDLFYTPGRLLIKYRPCGGWAADFRFTPLGDGRIGVVADGEYVQMDAEAFADWIVKSAVERLREVA